MPQNIPLTPEVVRYFEFMNAELRRINGQSRIDKRVGKKPTYSHNHPWRKQIKKGDR